MKKLALALSFVAALWILGLNTAAAQGHRGSHGKPSQTGVEHAEAVANPKGVQHGIENAEQSRVCTKALRRLPKERPRLRTKVRSLAARLTKNPSSAVNVKEYTSPPFCFRHAGPNQP